MIREEWKEQISRKGKLHAGPCSNSPLPPDFPVSCLRAQGVHRVYHSVAASCLASAASQAHPEAQAPLGLLSSHHFLFCERRHSACLHLHSLLDQKPISGVLAGTEKERGRVSRPNQEKSLKGPLHLEESNPLELSLTSGANLLLAREAGKLRGISGPVPTHHSPVAESWPSP